MKIKNQVTLALSIILISIGTTTAQKPTSSSADAVVEKLQRIEREQEIKDLIEKEVEEEIDRSVGEKLERTTSLLDANLSILNFWLLVVLHHINSEGYVVALQRLIFRYPEALKRNYEQLLTPQN